MWNLISEVQLHLTSQKTTKVNCRIRLCSHKTRFFLLKRRHLSKRTCLITKQYLEPQMALLLSALTISKGTRPRKHLCLITTTKIKSRSNLVKISLCLHSSLGPQGSSLRKPWLKLLAPPMAEVTYSKVILICSRHNQETTLAIRSKPEKVCSTQVWLEPSNGLLTTPNLLKLNLKKVKKIKYLMLETQVVRMSHYLPRKRLK